MTRRATIEFGPGYGWMDAAACLGEDVELFYPHGYSGEHLVQVERAKKVCAGCPVREACLSHALTTGDRYGIWGGLTEEERDRLRRRLRRSRPDAPKAPQETKQCRRCREVKPVSKFYWRPTRSDNRDPNCRTCCAELARERRAAGKTKTSASEGIAS